MAKKNKNENRVSNIPSKDNKDKSKIEYIEGMTILEFSSKIGKPVAQVIMKLIPLGIMANQNQTLDKETFELLALDFGFELIDEIITDASRFDEVVIEDDIENLISRAPVVTIMGHVDHGKTTLLDTIRNSRVVLKEAGGITQHIGAYQIDQDGYKITFIDTPGHAAFTQMRARGAKITDIVVLVVAADDGVMPQTEEAIEHAKASGCPIIVAVNKMDKPQANPDRVMEELTRFELIPEAWGGDTIFVNISALKGMGISDLLDNIKLIAEMKELKFNPNRLASGTVVESSMDKAQGPQATFLIQNGTLKVGDFIVCGDTFGKIRTMTDDRMQRYTNAVASHAVVVTGLDSVPQAGDKFMAFASEQEAKKIANERKLRNKAKEQESIKPKTIDELLSSVGNKKQLNIILKTDAHGSQEALKSSLLKINVPDVTLNVIRSGVGTITDDDINLALGSNALIIGFNVRPLPNVREYANQKGIQIMLYSIIYDAINDVENILKGMLDPVFKEEVTGYLEVREIFKFSKVGTIAGCYVTEGKVTNQALIRLLRDGVVVYEGKLSTLRRFKDDVKEVKAGFECGVSLENFNDIKVGDVIEASVLNEVKNV